MKKISLYENLNFHWPEGLQGLAKIPPSANPKKPAFMLKKLMAEYVWDLVHLEDNPYSFLEVQTLLGGVTIGGYSLFDQTQILNQKQCLQYIAKSTLEEKTAIDKRFILKLHSMIAKEEALKWGCFRDGMVGIGGTSHVPPRAEDLDEVFAKGLNAILLIPNPVEQALVYYFWGSMNQFFFDGNKRTSRAVMNSILLANNFYYLSVPGKMKNEFNRVMVNFYNTLDATEGMEFLLSCYRFMD